MEKRKDKQHNELVSNRVLSVFAAGAVLLWALSYLYKMFDYITSYEKAIIVSKVLLIASCAGIVAGIIWQLVLVKAKKTRYTKVINPVSVAGFFAVLAICCGLLLNNYILGMRLIYVFIPAVVICYLIYNVYQRSFFGITITHGIISLLLYFMSNSYNKQGTYVYVVISLLICAAAYAVTMAAVKNHGTIGISKLKVRVFEKGMLPGIKTTSIVYGASALAVLATLFIPNYAIIYIFYAFLAFLVCCAVYFTIRLM